MLKAILFDFDGVVVDTYEHTIYCFQLTLKHYNKKVPNREDFQGLLGLTTFGIIKGLLPEESEDKLEEMLGYYKIVSDKNIRMITLFNGAKEVIQKLSRNYKLAIVSSRRTESVHKLLKLHQLHQYFLVIIAREDIHHHKPHPEGITIALSGLKVKPEESVYIGDTWVDVETAHNAGMPCILIANFENNFGADYHILKISELPELITQISKE